MALGSLLTFQNMKCVTCRKLEATDTVWERVRHWFFTFFHEDILDLSQEKYTMGYGDGYKQAFELIQMRDGKVVEELQKVEGLVSRALRPLMEPFKFEGVDKDKIVSVTIAGGKPVLLLAGKPLTDLEKEQLTAEADYFTRSNLWRIMQETVKAEAVKTGIEKSKTWEETLSAKMMLHSLGLLDSIIKKILS